MAFDGILITAASRKGGCGKSMLVRIIAGELAYRGNRVGLIDCDPQRSLASWFNESRDRGLLPNEISLELAKDLDEVRSAVGAFEDCEVVIADTPGIGSAMTISLCNLSDLVLVPVRPAKDDADGATQMIGMLRKAIDGQARQPDVRVVFSAMQQTDRNTLAFRKAVELLQHNRIDCLATALWHRPTYANMAAGGGTAYTMTSGSDEALEKARMNGRLLVDEISTVLENGDGE